MFLKEHEGRELFIRYGIRVPEARLVTKDEAARPDFGDVCAELAESLQGFSGFALKAQILAGHRGQRGGVLFTDKKNISADIARMFTNTIGDEGIDEILIEGKLEIARELFVSLAIDRISALPVFLISGEGGADIEKLSLSKPSGVKRIYCDEVSVFPADKITNELSTLEFLTDSGRKEILDICRRLFLLFSSEDATLAEINPLAMTEKGEFIAIDAKIAIDDNALERRPSYLKRFLSHLTPLEQQASLNGLSYVELDGNIAIVGNGAGLVMATIDTVTYYGGQPANFCDIGGGASGEMMEKALDLVLRKKSVRCVLINVFGGITHCDEVARGILNYRDSRKMQIPLVVRMVGTNSDEAKNILAHEGIRVHLLFDDVCREAAQLSLT